MNILKLIKCAYLFHWTSSRLYNPAREAEKNRVQKLLRDPKNLDTDIPYYLDETGRPAIDLGGEKIRVNQHMIKEIKGEYAYKDLINGRILQDLGPIAFKYPYYKINYYSHCESLGPEKFKSLGFSMYDSTSLNYYRLNFRGRRLDFIISLGKIYEESSGNYIEMSRAQIFKRLHAESDKIRKELNIILDQLLG